MIVFQNLLTLQKPSISSRIQEVLLLSLHNSQLEACLCMVDESEVATDSLMSLGTRSSSVMSQQAVAVRLLGIVK